MRFQELKKYLGLFILAVAVIIVYKTFDNFGIILAFIAKVLNLLTPFIIGAVIAFVLSVPCKRIEILLHKTRVEFLSKHRRGLAVIGTYILVIALIALIMTAIIPQLGKSISDFIEQFPYILNSIIDWINSFGIVNVSTDGIMKFFSENILSFEGIISMFENTEMNKYAQGVITVGSTVINVFIGIIISVYILLERRLLTRGYKRFAKLCLPEKVNRNVAFYGRMIKNFINRYIGCQLLDACVVFILSFIALSIMRTEYAAMIALMVGSFNLIPYFGAVVAVLIAALITLVTGGFVNAVILVVVLIVLQQIDANVIQPRLVASSLSIKPLLVILGVILGGGLFGVAGMFLGVPLVALAKNIIDDLMTKKQLSLSSAGTTGEEQS